MLDSLDHLIIAVEDLAEAEKTYTRLLGRLPSWRGSHPGLGSSNLIYRLANTYLEFVAATGEGLFGEMIAKKLAEDGEGLMGIALGTSDAAQMAQRLRGAGLHPAGPLEGGAEDPATGLRRNWLNVLLPEEEAGGLFLFLIEHDDRLAIPLSPCAPGVSGRAAVEALDHVVIMTGEPERAQAFYRDTLGIRLALDHSREEWGVRQQFFRLGRTTLEVVTPLKKPHEGKDSLWGLAYRVPDMTKAAARLAAAGADISEVKPGRKKGTLVATIRPQTHGIPTILIGAPRAEAAEAAA